MRYDDAGWLLACGALTALGVVIAVLTYRKRGWAAAVRVFGWALLPIAVWMTGLGRVLMTLVVEVTRWVGGLVFSPRVWAGVALFGVAFVALGGAGFVRRRRRAAAERRAAGRATEGAKDSPAAEQKPEQKPVGKQKQESEPLEGLEEIDEILKKRGIE